jgi:hypothetical protein
LKWLQLMLVAVQIEKNHEKLSQNNWFWDWDLILETHKYEARGLATLLQCYTKWSC